MQLAGQLPRSSVEWTCSSVVPSASPNRGAELLILVLVAPSVIRKTRVPQRPLRPGSWAAMSSTIRKPACNYNQPASSSSVTALSQMDLIMILTCRIKFLIMPLVVVKSRVHYRKGYHRTWLLTITVLDCWIFANGWCYYCQWACWIRRQYWKMCM